MGFQWARFRQDPRHQDDLGRLRSEPGTHALILGVSTYLPAARQRFGLPDLDCAALSALRIAHWLVDSYRSASGAPLASLRLLLSPSDLERSSAAPADLADVPACTRHNVALALEEWVEDLDSAGGNVAFLYGAGHGMRYQGDGPILLLEDFWKPRGVANALDFSRSNLGLEGFRLRASFMFADCCQETNEMVDTVQGTQPLCAAWDPGQPQRRESWGLYRAAAGGGYAYGQRGGTTNFVEALIDGLNGRSATAEDSGRWEVTTDSLKATLPGLVAERHAEQVVRPTSEGPRPGALHGLDQPPMANLSVSVHPGEHAPTSSGWIDRSGTVFDRFTFADHPYTRPVESGSYRVGVEARPALPFVQPVKDVPVRPFGGGAVRFEVRS